MLALTRNRCRRRKPLDYQIEQLLPLVAELADKHTSGESSSVTYETAGALLEAVLFERM